MWIAADLGRDVSAQMAQQGEVRPGRRLAEAPPRVQFGLPLGGAAAAFYHQGRFVEMEREVGQLGLDIAAVEVDQRGLHLLHMLGAGMTVLGDGAGDDEDGAAFLRRPGGVGGEQVGCAGVGVDPDIVWAGGMALADIDEAAHGDEAITVAEHHVEEGGDLSGVQHDRSPSGWQRLPSTGKSIGGDWRASRNIARTIVRQWGRIVEVTPRVHPGRLQQRCAQGHIRHSKWSACWAMRGSRSPASVAWRMRTARSDIRCARAASKGTSS